MIMTIFPLDIAPGEYGSPRSIADKTDKEIENETLYRLKAGDSFYPGNGEFKVTRVPGGWVYSNLQTAVFVPYDNEFQGASETNGPRPGKAI